MNEKLKALQAQCVIHRGTVLDFDYDKYAELIVRECAKFVEDKFDFIGDEIIVKEKMLEHFGVEE